MAVPDDLDALAAAVGPEPDAVLSEMDRRAHETDFPTVGPAVGGWLRQLAGLLGAERVFEFGSGFGYSAYWLLGGMTADGTIVLTELDSRKLDSARAYLERGGYADQARFELGDAVETVGSHDGPFDIALIDNEKHRYVEAFEAVRSKVPVGGIVVADNAVEGPYDFGTLSALFFGDGNGGFPDDPEADAARGIAAYLEAVGAAEAFETTLLPVGEGLAVSRRVR